MLKDWVLTPGQVDRYDHLEVHILPGHNPDLVLTFAGGSEERIDLTTYQTNAALHALMRERGFRVRSDAATVRNLDGQCFVWASTGECQTNKAYMRQHCPIACRALKDAHHNCGRWAASGECATNARFMLRTCPVSCAGRDEL